MGDGKALQMGTSHELGQNFAKAFDIQYLDAGGQPAAVLDDVVGRVDPHGRRADHVPRRRRRPAGAAPPRPDPGRRGARARPTAAPATVAAQLAAELKGLGVRVELDDRVDLSFGRRVGRLGAEGRARPPRGRSPRPGRGRGHAWSGATSARSRPRRWASAAREASALLEVIQADMLAAATAERDARIRGGGDGRGGGRGRRATGSAVMPWAVLQAADGEARLREHGITVRCLVGGDGGLPAGEDEPDALAYVGRAY